MRAVKQSDIYDICKKTLQERRKYSNCYMTLLDIIERCEKQRMFVFQISETLILVDQHEWGNYLYYLCDSWEWIDKLALLREEFGHIIISIVQKDDLYERDVLLKRGLKIYKTYQRLRIVKSEDEQTEKNVLGDFCQINEIKKIRQMMDASFDIWSDCIPTDIELNQLIENQQIICIHVNNDLAGFIIFEDKGKTSYIRMACVDEVYRGKGVADKLMTMYFYMHENYRTYTLWYNISNEIAYGLYSKWGYQKENIYNYIFIV